jgi:hypothetical protein
MKVTTDVHLVLRSLWAGESVDCIPVGALDFLHQSRQDLGPIEPSVQGVPGFIPGIIADVA